MNLKIKKYKVERIYTYISCGSTEAAEWSTLAVRKNCNIIYLVLWINYKSSYNIFFLNGKINLITVIKKCEYADKFIEIFLYATINIYLGSTIYVNEIEGLGALKRWANLNEKTVKI